MEDAAPQEELAPQEVQMDLDDEGRPLIAQGGVVRLSLDDVLRAAERLRLISPRMDDGRLVDEDLSWLKAVPAQTTLVQNLIHFQILRHLAAEEGLSITDTEETTFIAENEILSPFSPLFQDDPQADQIKEALDAVGLTIDDVRHLAHDMILEQKFIDLLARDFSDDELWTIYQANRDMADLIVVEMSNTPTSEEVDRAVQEKDAQIRAYYRDNRARYFVPAGTFATLLQARRDADPTKTKQILEQAKRRMEKGEDPQEIAEELNLLFRQDIRIIPAADRAAADAEIGQIGISLSGPRGPHLWRIDERRDGVQRKLNRPLMREIAAQLVRQGELTSSNKERAQKIRNIFDSLQSNAPLTDEQIQKLVKELETVDARIKVHHTGLFGLSESGFIPQLGLSEELSKAVKDLSLDSPITDPLLDRERILIARLADRQPPTREGFEEARDEFRAEFLEQNSHRLAERAVQTYGQSVGVQMNLAPLGEHLGPPEPKVP